MDTLLPKKDKKEPAASFNKHCGFHIIPYCIMGEVIVKYL